MVGDCQRDVPFKPRHKIGIGDVRPSKGWEIYQAFTHKVVGAFFCHGASQDNGADKNGAKLSQKRFGYDGFAEGVFVFRSDNSVLRLP